MYTMDKNTIFTNSMYNVLFTQYCLSTLVNVVHIHLNWDDKSAKSGNVIMKIYVSVSRTYGYMYQYT